MTHEPNRDLTRSPKDPRYVAPKPEKPAKQPVKKAPK